MSFDETEEKDRLLEELDGRHGIQHGRSSCRHSHFQQGIMLILPSLIASFIMVLLVSGLRRDFRHVPRDTLIYCAFRALCVPGKLECLCATNVFPAPGNEFIEYGTRTFSRSRGEGKTPYQGWPDAAKDLLWDDLSMTGLFTYINEESASRLPNQTERVAQEGYTDQYMVVLDVFHQLHCLNFVRQAFYPERYGRGMYNSNGSLNYCNWLHIDHCLDQIRQSLMCSADVSPIPVQWNDATKSMRPRVDTIHTCRNFDKLKEWTLPRHLDVFHGAARVMDDGTGNFEIVDYLERKHSGKIEVEPSECNAI